MSFSISSAEQVISETNKIGKKIGPKPQVAHVF